MNILKYKNAIILTIIFLLTGCSHHVESTLTPQYTPISKGKVEYYTYGQGSPIILIPGYATDVSSWSRDFLSTLASNHQLIVLNNRQVGGSKIDSSDYKSGDLAEDVSQLIQQLHLKKPALLGISMGGMIAQQVAALHPDQIGQLILINTAISGHLGVHPSPEMEKKILNIPQNTLGFYLVAVDSFFPRSWKPKMAWKLATDRFLPKELHKVHLSEIIPVQRQLILDWTKDEVTAKKITELPMPVLIVNGEADSVIPPINSDILAQTIPRAQLKRWQDGGHAIIYQYPKEIAESIDEFLYRG